MCTLPDSDAQQVIDWWKEYGFNLSDCEYADVVPLFRELLERMGGLSIFGEKQVFDWMEKNGD